MEMKQRKGAEVSSGKTAGAEKGEKFILTLVMKAQQDFAIFREG